MKLLLSIFLLIGLLSTPAVTDVVESLDSDLELNLEDFSSELGCDIWLSKDSGSSWELVGKTFTSGGQYVYQSEHRGLHFFYIHARKSKDDNFRPEAGTKPHFKIVIKTFESENTAILYTNKRSMLINYDIDDASASLPQSGFESWLYVTENSGLSWSLYGADDDGVSPVPFVAPRDGLFGFRVISSDIAGQKESSPHSGSLPDILVRVDTQGPSVNLLSPQPYDLWVEKSTRKIRWSCKDESMDRLKSVEVYYSVGVPGDWKLIADNQPSSGVISWKIPASQNGRLFIQVRAVDKSGNEGIGQTLQPFFNRNVLEELLSAEVKEQANSYYETATICRKNRDYPKAIKYFRLCLQLNPYHVRAHNDIGITLLKMNLKEESFSHFEKGLKYSPSNESLLGNLSRLYIDQHQYDYAAQILERLVQLYPKDPSGLWLAAEVAFIQGDVVKARLLWERLTHLEFSEASRGPRYQQLAKARLLESVSGAPVAGIE
jgi:outer membrane protein assembly factor BamD (BamD/ComL family)